MSSIRRIVMAASVANLSDLILDMAGSRTPAARLSLKTPSVKSRPTHLRLACSTCNEKNNYYT